MIGVATVLPIDLEGIMAAETTGSCRQGPNFAPDPVQHAERRFRAGPSFADNVGPPPRAPVAVVQPRFQTARDFVRRVESLRDRVTIRSLKVPTPFARCLSS